MADLSSAFSEVCKKFEFSDINKTQKEVHVHVQKEVLTQVVQVWQVWPYCDCCFAFAFTD